MGISRFYQKHLMPTENPRVVLITGATSGIGRAAALLFAALGDHVTAVGRRADRLDALAQEIEAQGLPGRIVPVAADVTDPAAVQRAVGLTLAEFNRLDVLVAGAGIEHRGALVDADWDDLDTVLRTNIDGVLHSIRAAVPAMRASGGGQIVLLSSVLGPVPAPYADAYSASKAALEALARSLRGELKADGIHVSILRVGQTNTEFAARRLGQPGRVATRWPAMTPEHVAGGIARALERRPRTLALRWIDALFVWAGQRFPALMDRLLARVYG